MLASLIVVAPAAADPFYGVYAENGYQQPAAIAPELNRQADNGAGLVREALSWAQVEKAPGVYDWSAFDTVVTAAAARGMSVLPIVYDPPSFRSSRGSDTRNGMFPPRSNTEYAQFLRKAVDRYGQYGSLWCLHLGTIKTPICRSGARYVRSWQIWNEENLPVFWPTGPSATQFTALLREAYTAVKAGDAGAEVVLGGLSVNATFTGDFLDQLYAAGAAPYFDTIAIHPYSRSVGAMLDRVRETRRIADSHGDSATPIRITEYGWASGGRSNFGGSVPLACQAAIAPVATRALANEAGNLRIAGIVWFMWNDRPDGGNAIWPFYMGLVNKDGSAKPTLAAWTNAVRGGTVDRGAVARNCPPENQALDTDPFTTLARRPSMPSPLDGIPIPSAAG